MYGTEQWFVTDIQMNIRAERLFCTYTVQEKFRKGGTSLDSFMLPDLAWKIQYNNKLNSVQNITTKD